MNNEPQWSDSLMQAVPKMKSMQPIQNIAGINFSQLNFILKIFKMIRKKFFTAT